MMASISSCPEEILYMIAAAADPIDLANIRLVSRQWCAVSSKLFGLAKLRHPRFIISPYSLQGLVDLTAHPILGPCIKSINLGSYRLKKHLVNTQPNLDTSRANAAALTQFRFEQTGLHLTLLAKAFANLCGHGITPMLGTYEDIARFASGNKVCTRGYGYDELYGPIDVFGCGKTQVAQALIDLIKASLNSECPPRGVSVELKWDPSDREAVSQHPGLYQLLQNLSIKGCGGLKSGKDLTVTLVSGKRMIEDKHYLKIREQGRHLSLFQVSIEDYEGSSFPQLEPDIFGPLSDACYHGQFHEITLSNCEIDVSVFRLFREQSKFLRRLTLSSIVFHDDEPDDAVDLLLILRDGLALHTVTLKKIVFNNKHNDLELFEKDDDYQEWIGPGEIVASLDVLIKWVQFSNIELQRFGDDDDNHDDHGDENNDDENNDDENEDEDESASERSGEPAFDHQDHERCSHTTFRAHSPYKSSFHSRSPS